MLKNNFKYFLLFVTLIISSCAKRGSITGGDKDTIAPVLKMSFPKNFSTNFKGNVIKLTFDEYIKLKDLNKQLIVSPPMKNELLITPTSATDFLTIKINDTLQSNTTYSLNFGQSITDNNEGNPYNQFKYVFSTGATIDSLTLSGTVKDAYQKEVESFVSVMLYEIDAKFKDSTVYKDAPRYVSNTLDSLKTFKLENLKAGKYLLVAMKDYNSNNKFNPNKDKIGFRKQHITIPNDSIFDLKIFKEVLPLKTHKPFQTSGNRLILPYEGVTKKMKITLKNGETILPTIVTKFPKKDSLQVWYKPLKVDSLFVETSENNYNKNYILKIKDKKKDSLKIESIQNGSLNFRDSFTLESNVPLIHFDKTKIKFLNKDKKEVDFTTNYDEFNQRLVFDFKKEPLENYSLKLLPKALTDYLDQSNDTLKYKFSTRNTSDYGNLIVQLKNVKHFPVIVELTNEKGDVIASEYSEGNTKIEFLLLEPSLFTLRLIYDENKNKQWDSGSFLERRQAEEIVYLSGTIDVRANWDVEQLFDVSLPYIPEIKKKKIKKEIQTSGF